jgi:hypothetical protein
MAKNNRPNLDWTKEGLVQHCWEAIQTKIWQHIVERGEQQEKLIQYFYQQQSIFEYCHFMDWLGTILDWTMRKKTLLLLVLIGSLTN